MNKFIDNAVIKIYNHEGALCVAQFDKLPFIPKRLFYVKNVPLNTERGNHAHIKTHQLLICISGYIKLITHNGKVRSENIMEPNDCVHLPPMVWDSQQFLSENAVLLVLASTYYNKKDYITDFTEFKKMVK